MDNNSLFKNSVFNVIYKLTSSLFPLIYTTYLSRVLFADGVGKVSYAQNILQYFAIIASLGIPNYGVREIAKVRDDKKQVNKLFSELFWINFVSTTICLLAYYSLIFINNSFEQERELYVVVGLQLFFNYFSVDWFYQGEEQYKYITIRNFVIKVFALVSICVFVNKKEDYIIYAIIYALTIAGNNIFNMIHLHKFDIHIGLKGIDVKKHYKPVFLLLCTAISVELYTLVDTTMLGVLCSDEVVGYYTNTMRLVKTVIVLVTSISGVLLPRLSFYYSHGRLEKMNEIINQIFSVLLYLFLPCGIGIFVTADLIVPVFFGESFRNAIITLKSASFLIYALGFSNFFGTQILLTFGSEKKLLICTIMGAVTNMILNIILIPRWQQNGAAFASVISELVVTLLTYYFCSNYICIRLSFDFLMSTFTSVFMMVVSVLFVKKIECNMYLLLICSVLTGILVYILIGVITKNEVLLWLKNRFAKM
jgi:O-antigen/teichoic acid export membrane protein